MKVLTTLRHNSSGLNIVVIAVILVFGFIIRLLGIGVGLPDSPDPRETLIAQDILNLINFTAPPSIYNWPGTSWFYLVALVSKILSIFGMDITETNIIWIARFINVILSTGTIWLTYCLGTKCYNKRVGQIAAAFLTVAMLHVTNESRFALVDIPATFCVTLFLWFVSRDTNLSFRTCVLLGITAGISIAVKFTTVFVCLSLLTLFQTKYFYRKFVTIMGICAITFSLLCPYWLIDLFSPVWNHFFDDFWFETIHYHRGHFGLFSTNDTGLLQRFLYLGTLFKWGLGLPLALMAGISVACTLFKTVSSLVKRHTIEYPLNNQVQHGLLFLSFIIPYLLFIGSYKVSFTRHLLILYPSLTVLIGVFLTSFDKRIALPIGIAVWLYSFIYTAAFVSVTVSQPTGQEATQWVSENIPQDESISRSPTLLFDWLIPDIDLELAEEESEWVLIIYPNMEVFLNYQQNPRNYSQIDWYPLQEIALEDTLQFYNVILGEESKYKLHKTFQRIPRFIGIRISDNDAPFPIRALIHPEIRLYRRFD
ncbi:MAG: glycosyltransferase family 39 protein [Candidatus Poribacteria bacterium]|nr:glycosyltransferase family 39 protein [Candidatus Poribacteria bacterium]